MIRGAGSLYNKIEYWFCGDVFHWIYINFNIIGLTLIIFISKDHL